MIRPAKVEDASRIAEILIFTKRMNYREIFHDDAVSFGEMQVYPLAKEYIDHPEKLSGIWVYDDGFVKGILHIDGKNIAELYVDSFFENRGIGSELIRFAIETKHCSSVWVLEKNVKAIRFYERNGFRKSVKREINPGTEEYLINLVR